MADLFNLKAPKTRPILFKGDMVRSILDGTKTQTRRLVKFPVKVPEPMRLGYMVKGSIGTNGPYNSSERALILKLCPYGVPGDRLYVREAFAWADQMVLGYELEDPNAVAYRADQTALLFDFEPPRPVDVYAWNWDMLKWRPAIHMPKWASRIMLEVTGVRAERLQKITYADAIAEGLEAHNDDGVTYYGPLDRGYADPRNAFESLWDSINAKRGFPWANNDWVWVTEFKRVEAPNA